MERVKHECDGRIQLAVFEWLRDYNPDEQFHTGMNDCDAALIQVVYEVWLQKQKDDAFDVLVKEEVNGYMLMPTNQWEPELFEHVKKFCEGLGVCGQLLHDGVEDWVRTKRKRLAAVQVAREGGGDE